MPLAASRVELASHAAPRRGVLQLDFTRDGRFLISVGLDDNHTAGTVLFARMPPLVGVMDTCYRCFRFVPEVLNRLVLLLQLPEYFVLDNRAKQARDQVNISIPMRSRLLNTLTFRRHDETTTEI